MGHREPDHAQRALQRHHQGGDGPAGRVAIMLFHRGAGPLLHGSGGDAAEVIGFSILLNTSRASRARTHHAHQEFAVMMLYLFQVALRRTTEVQAPRNGSTHDLEPWGPSTSMIARSTKARCRVPSSPSPSNMSSRKAGKPNASAVRRTSRHSGRDRRHRRRRSGHRCAGRRNNRRSRIPRSSRNTVTGGPVAHHGKIKRRARDRARPCCASK